MLKNEQIQTDTIPLCNNPIESYNLNGEMKRIVFFDGVTGNFDGEVCKVSGEVTPCVVSCRRHNMQ